MARIQLMGSTFQVLPEGHYAFHIDEVEYDEAFGKMVIKMTTVDGKKHQERYQLLNAKNEFNEPALMAFSWLAKVALHNENMETVDPAELVGTWFQADCVHEVKPNRNDPTKTVTFVKLNNKAEYTPEEAPADSAADLDLDALLN